MSAPTARDDARRFARQALPISDPAGALVMAQLSTTHAVLALVDQLAAKPEEKDTREGESTPGLVVYRASHESLILGHYLGRAEARRHCETLMRREVGAEAFLGWVPDHGGGDAPEELCLGLDVECTGYLVTPVEVASEYDEGADE